MDFCGSKRRGSVPKVGPVRETTMKPVKGRVVHPNESKMRSKQSSTPSPVGKKKGNNGSEGMIKKCPASAQIRKSLTLPPKNQIQDDDNDNDDSVVLRKVKSEPVKNLEDLDKRPGQPCKELGVCEEMAISSNLSNGNGNGDLSEEEEEEEEEEEGVMVTQEKKLVFSDETPITKKEAPLLLDHQNPTKPEPIQFSGHAHVSQTPQTKLQSLSDLIMWRDVPKSSLVFGIGVFAIVSSSYTWEINISFISVVSYIGLVYLAAVFLFRSLICRGSNPLDEAAEQDCLVGEEDAVRLTKMVLPYLNEFLLNLRALFSGDPPTTMKLAVLLFILARCGGSITIWKLAKLGFLGIFTVPKVCSAYSPQLASFGTFWVERLGDVWRSCSHKKAIAFGIFTLIWNISSIVLRIWTLFMLFVSFKCYQQCSIKYLGESQCEEEDLPEDKSKLVEENDKMSNEQ